MRLLHRLTKAVICFGAICAGCAALAQGSIVIGQSLPLTGAGFPVANRVLAGSRTIVDRINASGGVLGRQLELVTLNDGGDAKLHAQNIRSLITDKGALAIVNCVGEKACMLTAEVTRELKTPLIGPMSGAKVLRSAQFPQIYTLRPEDAREADVLAKQIKAMGITRALLLTDNQEPARTEALVAALKSTDLQLVRRSVDGDPTSAEAAFDMSNAGSPQALILHVGHDTLDALDRLPAKVFASAPSTVMSFSSNGLTQITRLFRERLIGYTSVVPPLENIKHLIVRDFLRDVETFGNPEAVSFEGFEAYLSLRTTAEAIKKIGIKTSPVLIGSGLEKLGTLDFGGFRVAFGRENHHGSDYVEIGIRARNGRLLR